MIDGHSRFDRGVRAGRRAATALIAILLPSGVAAAAAPSVSLSVEDTNVAFPGLLVMQGRVTGSDGWVEIQAKRCGERAFSFTSAEIERGVWRVFAPGKAVQTNAIIRAKWRDDLSTPVHIRVQPSIWIMDAEAEGRLGVPLPRERQGIYDIAISTLYYYAGGQVLLQRLNRATNRWRTFRTLRLKRGSHGISYAFFRPGVSRGTWIRAVRPASRDGCYIMGVSDVVVTN